MDNAALYRALADDTRRNIILLLLRHDLCVSALAHRLNISESAVSKHLRVLKEAGLLSGERRGYHMHYSIERERLRALAWELEAMADTIRSGEDAAAGLVLLPMAPQPRRGN